MWIHEESGVAVQLPPCVTLTEAPVTPLADTVAVAGEKAGFTVRLKLPVTEGTATLVAVTVTEMDEGLNVVGAV